MQLTEFLTTSFQNVRSSQRTDDLHPVVLEQVLVRYPKYRSLTWKYEVKVVDAYGGTFQLDTVGYNENGEVVVVILDKANNSNINKNIKNYANTTVGEAARICYAPNTNKLEKVFFVSVLPRVAPVFTNTGAVSRLDDVVSAKQRTNVSRVLNLQYGEKVEVIDIYYDIDGITTYTHSDQFATITVSNVG